ncbi:hypothetical protein B0H14DRAFT_2620367 [Mycena olivaceomarginata]|nr:hypothetical protein B0H14DRAFT_2620367 [Mycena olivaceomarginata]
MYPTGKEQPRHSHWKATLHGQPFSMDAAPWVGEGNNMGSQCMNGSHRVEIWVKRVPNIDRVQVVNCCKTIISHPQAAESVREFQISRAAVPDFSLKPFDKQPMLPAPWTEELLQHCRMRNKQAEEHPDPPGFQFPYHLPPILRHALPGPHRMRHKPRARRMYDHLLGNRPQSEIIELNKFLSAVSGTAPSSPQSVAQHIPRVGCLLFRNLDDTGNPSHRARAVRPPAPSWRRYSIPYVEGFHADIDTEFPTVRRPAALHTTSRSAPQQLRPLRR